jgi:CBS domain-containing protein
MRLKQNIHTELVADLPLREAILIQTDTPISVAIERMREKQLGCAIVVDADGRLLGTFTERIVIDLVLQQPENLTSLIVGDHMDRENVVVKKSDTILAVYESILKQATRFVCVVDDEGTVVGLTGQKGLSEYVAEHYPQQVMVQRVGGRPGMKKREGA